MAMPHRRSQRAHWLSAWPSALALLLLLGVAPSAGAQQEALRTLADSIRKETCRGGTLSASGLSCSGAKLSPRVTAFRRYANRLDSLAATWVPVVVHDTVIVHDTVTVPDSTPVRVDVSFDHTVTVSWPGGQVGAVPNGQGLLCATVQVGGATYLGDPAILATVASPDSVGFVPTTISSVATLRRECARVFPATVPVNTIPTWPIAWSQAYVAGAERRISVPVATAIKSVP